MLTSSSRDLLVLGRGFNPDGTPTTGTRLRGQRAAALSQKEAFHRIIFSGSRSFHDHNPHNISEAKIMHDIAVDEGLNIPVDGVYLEEDSTSTIQNVRNSSILLGGRGLLIVTGKLYQPRTKMIANTAFHDIPVEFSPTSEPLGLKVIASEAARLAITAAMVTVFPYGDIDQLASHEDSFKGHTFARLAA